MKDSTNLLKKIIDYKEDPSHADLFLAGKCLTESLLVSPDLRNEITRKLLGVYLGKNEHSSSMETALEILKEIKNPEIVQTLIEKSKDKDIDVRCRTAYALSEIGVGELRESVAEGPEEELQEFRLEEVENYKRDQKEVEINESNREEVEIVPDEIILSLIELLRDTKAIVRWRAANALSKIRPKEAVHSLMRLFKDDKDYIRSAAARALGNIGAKEAVVPLIGLLKDNESFVRRHAVVALGKIKAKEAIFPLIELLKDKEDDIRASAATALGEIRAKEAVSHLNKLSNDKAREVRTSATSALKRIGYREQ